MYAHSKLYSVLSYFTWIGWIISFILHDRRDGLVRQHLNQALILNVCSSIGTFLTRFDGIVGWAGGIINIAVLVLFILGIVRAFKMSAEPLPLIGELRIL